MRSPKTLIVVKSIHHGNTAKVAEALAKELEAEVRDPDEIPSESLEDYELIGFGSGIYFGMFHPALKRYVRNLPVSQTPRVAFVFSTSGLPFLSRLWHLPLKRALRKKGREVIGEFRCPGFDTVGPLRLIGGLNRGRPNDYDLSRAREFAQTLRQTLSDRRNHPSDRSVTRP